MALRSRSLSAVVTATLVVFVLLARAGKADAQSSVSDPEVQAQIDLFSAWLEGQIEIRELPGIVVGVVSAAMLTDEPFGTREIFGSMLIMSAALVEVLQRK